MFYVLLFLGLLTSAYSLTTNTNDTQCSTVVVSEPSTKKTVRFMQYNVEWFFLKTYNGCPGSSCSWHNLTEATNHMNSLAKVVGDLNPDVLNLCEVEGCYELSQLNGLLHNQYQPYLLFGTDSSTGQNVGLLSKITPATDLQRTSGTHTYPVAGSNCGYTGSPGSSGVSKNYYTSYEFGNTTVHVIGTHLLAYPTDASRCASREAQASVLQDLIVDLLGGIDPKTNKVYDNPNVGLVIMGDMNDYDGQVQDLNNDKPISMVLDILKGTSGTYANKYELESVANYVNQDERYTDWWDKNNDCSSSPSEMTMIDHFLVTPNLASKISKVTFPHPYSENCGTYNSDHYPIVVDFEF
jgi:exonuclease III